MTYGLERSILTPPWSSPSPGWLWVSWPWSSSPSPPWWSSSFSVCGSVLSAQTCPSPSMSWVRTANNFHNHSTEIFSLISSRSSHRQSWRQVPSSRHQHHSTLLRHQQLHHWYQLFSENKVCKKLNTFCWCVLWTIEALKYFQGIKRLHRINFKTFL